MKTKIWILFFIIFKMILSVSPQSSMDYISKHIGVMKYVVGGSFQRDDNTTNISVVSAFRIAEKEITRSQFVSITGLPDPTYVRYSSSTDDPVQMVNWYQAILFCNKLSIVENLIPVYSIHGSTNPDTWGNIPFKNDIYWDAVIVNWEASGYRLPTEMEWLWAAMGADSRNPGKLNADGYNQEFSGSTGSNLAGDYVWYYDNSEMKTHSVGTKIPNELGVYDLSGNVWEWCWDRFNKDYPSGTLVNFKGDKTGYSRVAHGGSWSSFLSFATITSRQNNNPGAQLFNYGFRVVRR